LIVTFEIKIDF